MTVPDELVENVLAAARSQRGGDFSDELRDSLNALHDHPQSRAARLQIAAQLPTIDSPTGASFLAIWLGGGVEGGLDPVPTTLPILDTMLRWSRTVRQPRFHSEY